MPWPIRLGPQPRMITLSGARAGPLRTRLPDRAHKSSSGRASCAFELSCTGVDGLVDGTDAEAVPQRPHTVLAGELRTQCRHLTVRQTAVLRAPQQRLVQHRRVDQLTAQFHQPGDLRDEPRIDAGGLAHRLDARAQPQCPLDLVDPAFGGGAQIFEDLRDIGPATVLEASRIRPPWSPARTQYLAECLDEVAAQAPSPHRPTSSWWSVSRRRRETSRTQTAVL